MAERAEVLSGLTTQDWRRARKFRALFSRRKGANLNMVILVDEKAPVMETWVQLYEVAERVTRTARKEGPAT